jgi:hypothetical protein
MPRLAIMIDLLHGHRKMVQQGSYNAQHYACGPFLDSRPEMALMKWTRAP